MLLDEFGPFKPKTRVVIKEDRDSVAGAIARRIMNQRLDLVSKYGVDKVIAAIDDVADYVSDTEEIGTSDVSGWVKQVERTLQSMGPRESAGKELKELNMLAPRSAYIKTAPNQFFKASWRETERLSGDPAATSVTIAQLPPQTVASLGLEARLKNKNPGAAKDRTLAPGGNIGQSGPLSPQSVTVVDLTDPSYNRNEPDAPGLPPNVKTELYKFIEKQGGVAEGQQMGEYSRVLQALRLYYPRLSMEELNTPDWYRVIANKANVPVEYAGKVINDFTRPVNNDDDYDESDEERGVAEGKKGKGSAAYKEAEDYLVFMSDALTDREWYDESYAYHEWARNLYDLGIGGVMKELKQAAEKTGSEWWKEAYDEFSEKFGKFAEERNIERGMAEGTIDIGSEWMSDTELDQYVPDQLEQEWRELVGYDMEGRPHPLWANMTGGYEPDVNDPQDRANMVKVANKWFSMKRIPGVKFLDVRDADDELEWLVQIGQKGVSEGFMSEVDIELHNIARSEDEEELIDALGGLKGVEVQIALENMMEDLADQLAAKGMNDVINDQDKMIELLMDKLVEEYSDGDIETNESLRRVREFKDEDSTGDLRTGWLIKKAKRQFPMATSDAEAVAMWMNDKTEQDVARLDRVNDIEDAMIDKLSDFDKRVRAKIQDLEGRVKDIESIRSNESRSVTAEDVSKYLAEMKESGYDI